MEISKVWQKYKKSGDQETRNILIENYLELVKITAGRLKSTMTAGNVEMDDLISYGILGLMDAIEKFDISKNVKFETYAQLRIRGAMIDQLRKYDWAPRSLRQKSRDIEETFRLLENKMGRSPTDKEMAAELGVNVDEFLDLLGQISSLSMLSLEEMLENRMESKITAGDRFNASQPEKFTEIGEMKLIIQNSINDLPSREKLIITLYYYEELTYKEIGKIMGVSESRISQLHSKAVIRLKDRLLKHEMDLSLGRG